MTRAPSPAQHRILARFGAGMAIGNLIWEVAHMPLYTLWQSGTWAEIAYGVVHCTLGDMLIALVCLGGALALFGRKGWPDPSYVPVALAMIAAALCYTVFSEWLNTEVRQAWAYRDIMPRLPPAGTGLTPALQWIVVPGLAFWWAKHGIGTHSQER
jgi:hypothetical protein